MSQTSRPPSIPHKVGWSPHPKLKDMLKQRYSGLGATTICEEAINIAKNRRKYYGKRFRKPETVTRAILSSDLMGGRHKFDQVAVDMVNTKKTDTLTKAAFSADPSCRSLRFQDIVSSGSGVDWWSPCAQGLCAPAADLKLLADIAPNLLMASCARLGKLFHIKHKFAFQTSGQAASSVVVWYLPLEAIDNSAVLAWHATKIQCSANGDSYFSPDLTVSEPVLVSVVSLRDIKAQAFEWRSPVYQFRKHTTHFRDIPMGVRPLAVGGKRTVVEIGVRAGFWCRSPSWMTWPTCMTILSSRHCSRL